MKLDFSPTVVLPKEALAEFHNAVRRVEEKLRCKYPEAQFELISGPDEEFHLQVFTNEPSIWSPMELVDDELDELRDENGIFLYVVPVSLAERREQTATTSK